MPFHFGQRPLIVRYDFPLAKAHVYYESLMAYAQRYCADYDRIFVVTQAKTHHTNEEQWRINAGDFVTDIVFGRLDNYPNVELLEELVDGSVFQIQCAARS